MLISSQTANSLSSVSKISNYIKRLYFTVHSFYPIVNPIQGHFVREVKICPNIETCFGYLKLNSGQGWFSYTLDRALLLVTSAFTHLNDHPT